MLHPIEVRLIQSDSSDICTQDTMLSLGCVFHHYYPYLTSDPNEILQRQRLFTDLLENEEILAILRYFREQLSALYDLATQVGNFENMENEEILYSIKELLIFTQTIDTLNERYSLLAKEPSSKRLEALFTEINHLSNDPQYTSIREWLSRYAKSLQSLESITLGVNLDAQLNAKEVGIISFNDKPFVTAKGIDGFLKSYKGEDGFSCICTLGIKELGLTERNAISINREFYLAINQSLKRSARNIKKLLNDTLQKTIRSFIALKDEITFLIECTDYCKKQLKGKLPLCFPEIGQEIEIHRLYNPQLLGVCSAKDIVPNSFCPHRNERVFILTGPNSGGKTNFIKSLGLTYLFFQLGLPVTAKQAKLKPLNRIVTHFVEKSYKQSEGRLANEAARLRENIYNITENTLFLLDETFSGTNSYDAGIFSEALVKYLCKLPNCYTIYITHILELNDRIQHLKNEGSYYSISLLAAGIQNGKRSYEIVPYNKELSLRGFAKDIILENGLGFLFE